MGLETELEAELAGFWAAVVLLWLEAMEPVVPPAMLPVLVAPVVLLALAPAPGLIVRSCLTP